MSTVPKHIFADRRQEFMNRIGPDAVAVVHSPPETHRNGTVLYPYRQSSDFYYLTGFAEPGATLFLRPGAESERFTLFVRPRDPEREAWDGRRAGIDGALERFGADVAFPQGELTKRLPDLIKNCDELYYPLGGNSGFDGKIARAMALLRQRERNGSAPPLRIVDPRLTLHEMRLFKSPEEIAALERAAAITDEAHRAAMRLAAPGVAEHELEATLTHIFRLRGGAGPGYQPIVGTGENATILHYTENESTLASGELVLIDAGCEFDYYTADVTRTFPVDGHFQPAHRRAYEHVLAVQERAIAMVRPGVTIDEIHEQIVADLTAAMIDLGLLEGPAEKRIADGDYRTFYRHRSSHWLGMDVHDVGAYNVGGSCRPLEAGMVITVEPGLYVDADAENAPAELRGLGIRIEDDLLVTEGGHRVLTDATPKQVDDVEAACRE